MTALWESPYENPYFVVPLHAPWTKPTIAAYVDGGALKQALADACVKRSREIGTGGLGLHTSDSMVVAMRMYERMGFVRDPEQDFQPPGGELVKAYRLVLE